MEEQQVQEPIYLAYGNDAQVEQNSLLTAAANSVQPYVAKQPWSNKRKQMFMDIYTKIMQQGVTGASNASGIWNIQHNGDPILTDNMSKKEKEMAQEVAYFIQQQMQGLSAAKQKEEEKKKELTKFDNTAFTSGFRTHIGNSYGGQAYNDWIKEWNNLDAKDKYGMRATTNRAAALAQQLRSYKDSFKAEDYDFEGSPFANADDFKSRLDEAIKALESPSPDDDREALNKLGLRFDDYLKTGLDSEATTTDGRTFATGREYVEWAQEQERLKAEADAKAAAEKQKAAQQKAYDNTLFITRGSAKLQGRNPQELKTLYGSGQKLVDQLNQYSLTNINNLTPDQQSEIHGAYRFMANEPIDDETLRKLQSSSSGRYKGAAPNRFRKIKGVDGFVWDSVAKQVIQFQTRQQMQQSPGKDLFDGVQTSEEAKNKAQQDYMNNPIGTNFTSAEIAELGSIAADIVSIVDPEPISAAIAGIGAAGARNYAKLQQPKSWGLTDYLWQAADYITGAIGAIPIAGDAILAGKVIKNLRRLGRLGAWNDLISNADPAVKAAWKGINDPNYKMTAGDWAAIGQFLRGITGHGRLNQTNLAQRKVMQHRGVDTTPQGMLSKVRDYSNKMGFTSTKPNTSTATNPTVKVEIDEKPQEIEISAKSKKQLEKDLKKAGNDQSKKDAAVRNIDEIKNNANIPDKTKVVIVSESKLRNKKWTPWKSDYSDSFGSTPASQQPQRGVDDFDNWLNTRSNWSRIAYGRDNYLKWIDSRMQKNGVYSLNSQSSAQQQTNNQQNQQSQNLSIEARAERFTNPTRRAIASYNNTIKEALNPTKSRTTGMNLDNVKKASSSIVINGKTIKFDVAKNKSGDFELIIDNGGTISTHALTKGNNTQAEFDARKIIAKTVDDAKKAARGTFDKKAMNEFFKQIKNLKKQGFLKQGGTIDKQKISEYLNYINK